MKRWRYRPFQAVAVIALAALLAACAAFAPLYFRAMQQSLTDVVLETAPPVVSSVRITAVPPSVYDPTRPVEKPESVAAALPEQDRDLFHAPVLGYTAHGDVPEPLDSENDEDATSPKGALLWRSGQCEHVEITEGRCPEVAGEIAVTSVDAESFDLGVGSTVVVDGAAGVDGEPGAVPLEVVGTYRQVVGDYWLGQVLTGKSGLPLLTIPGGVLHDDWLTPRSTFEDDALGVDTATSTAGYGVDQDAIGIDEMLALPGLVEDLRTQVPPDGQSAPAIDTGLDALATDVQEQVDQARITVPLLLAQLFLLSAVVLWLVLAAMTEQRRPDIALARLRGHSRRGARRLLLTELMPITLLAVLPGAALAYAATWVVGGALLPHPLTVELRWPFAAALALAAAVLAGVTLLACWRAADEPVDRLLRRVPPRRTRWALGVGEAVVVAGAGAVTLVFAAGGLEGSAAIAAPGLVGITVGVLLAHLAMPAAAATGRRLLRRGRVRAGTSVLDVARSPATRRIIAIVTVGSALVVFSADALVVGQRNRTNAAQQEAGAPMVATVFGTDLKAVREVIEEVDPSGTAVTPVVRVAPLGDDVGTTVGVLPAAFREVAFFPNGDPGGAAWARLAAPDVEPIVLTGSALSVDVTGSTLESVRPDGSSTPVTVGLDLVHSSGETLHMQLGELAPGESGGSFERTVSCREGCVLTGAWFRSPATAKLSGSATVTNLVAEPSGAPVPLGPDDQWTSEREESGGLPQLTLTHAWLPIPVPTLVAGQLPPGGSESELPMTGLDGQLQPATAVGRIDAVPGSPPDTVVADLDLLLRGHQLSPDDQLFVWFADEDPRLLEEVTAALSERGIAISGSTTVTDVRRSYDASASAWSLQLAILVAVLAVLIELLALVVSAASGWRGRTRDLAALRMSGVGRRSIRSIAVAAQLPAVLVGVVAGALSGIAGARLAMPIVPLFATAPDVSTLDLHTAPGAVLVAVGASLVVLCLGGVIIGRAIAGRARLQRLRETV